MSKFNDIIRNLEGLRSLAPAAEGDIAAAEQQLNIHFSAEFKDYLLEFGAIYSKAVELKGIAKTKGFNVAEVTEKARETDPDFPMDMYVVSETGINGIIVCQKEDGTVYECEPNHDPKIIASSLYDYVQNIILLQEKSD